VDGFSRGTETLEHTKLQSADFRLQIVVLLLAFGHGATLPVFAQPSSQVQPRFQSGVEVISIDVTVVDPDSRPILNLKSSDFVVEVDGRSRRLVSADWIPLTAGPAGLSQPPRDTSSRPAAAGRVIVFVIDQLNIRFGGMVGHQTAINNFIDRLEPSDQVAVVGLGPGAKSLSLTTDRSQVKEALSRMVGQRGIPWTESTPEALLRLIDGLKSIETAKTIVLISQGFGISLEQRPIILDLERRAAEARTIVYALRLDERIANTTPREPDSRLGPTLADPGTSGSTARGRAQRLPVEPLPPGPAGARGPDRATAAEGLYATAAATGGAMFTVVMSADSALARLASEISGYYLLAVESIALDHDGKQQHRINVSVNRRGAVVRSRRQLR
jgi:VWFA-related protein